MPNIKKRLKTEYGILILALFLGIGTWVIDAFIDYLFFYDRSLAALLLFDVPVYELYMRGIAIISLVIFAGFVSRLLAKQRDTEQRLREKEKRNNHLAAIVESTQDAVIGTSLEGIILSWNSGAEQIYGYTAEEIKGQPIACLVPPSHSDELPHILDQIKQGKRVEPFETVRLTKHGEQIPISLTVSPIRNAAGEVVGASAIARNITERKQAEAHLAQLVAHLMLINDIGDDIAAQLALDGVLRHTVQLVQKTFNYPHVALFLVEENLIRLKAVAGLYTDRFTAEHSQSLEKGIPGWVARHGQKVVAQDVTQDPRYNPLVEEISAHGSELSLPIKIGQQTTGVLDIQSAVPNAFSDSDVIALETLTNQIAVAIANARLYEAAQQELVERRRSEQNLQNSLAQLEGAYQQAKVYADELKQEIAHRKHTREALQTSEERFRQVVASLSAHVYVTQVTEAGEHINLYLSPNVEALTGYVQEKFVADWSFWPSTVIHPEDRSLAAEQAARLSQGQSSEVEYRLIRADNQIIWVRDSARVHYQDTSKIVYGLVSDITERKQAQEEIQTLNLELEQRVIDRTRELSALYEVTAVGSEALDLQTMLARSLERVLTAMQSNEGHVHLLEQNDPKLAAHQGLSGRPAAQLDSLPLQESLAGWIAENGEPLVVSNSATHPISAFLTGSHKKDSTYTGAPMRAGGQIIGVLGVFRDVHQQFSVEEVALLSSIADQIGVMVENARLRRQTELAAVRKERERLARELHDSVTQSLYSLTLLAGGGQRFAKSGTLENVEDYFKDLGEIAQQALKEMRLLVYELRPAVLEQEGLIGALQQRLDSVEGRSGVETRLLVEDMVRLPPPVEEDLYRIAQEALNNALKHAAATLVTVRIYLDDGDLVLQVTDNGLGFDPNTLADTGGIGLTSIRERVKRIGGTLSVTSVPGTGTTIKTKIRDTTESIQI